MSLPKIEVKHLSKIYHHNLLDTLRENTQHPISAEDKLVLNDVSVTFNSGEIIGLIGRNGAGKSTLLSILAGISQPTRGQVNIVGKVTAVMTLGIGLREDLTGRENIYLDGQIQGKTRQQVDKIIEEIIEFTELKEFIDRPVKVYSTGMKSRLAFAMLVGIEPEILIIDEALSAGDAFFAQKASQKIKEICKKGKIVIVVSHSMTTIQSMCNRCVWLEKGCIIMDDEPEKVTRSYLQIIQEEDQHKELEKYGAVSQVSPEANYKIQDVILKLAGSDYQQAIFYTKDHMTIVINLIRQRQGEGILHVYIERIDGLLISHEQYNFNLYEKNAVHFMTQFSIDALALNKAYYQLKIELIENKKITNQFIRFFEVKNNSMATGGVSLLHYPAEIMLMNEDVDLCSDSIELITE